MKLVCPHGIEVGMWRETEPTADGIKTTVRYQSCLKCYLGDGGRKFISFGEPKIDPGPTP